jgi:hypothetical protein
MTKREIKEAAQDRMVEALVAAALQTSEEGNEVVAEAIRAEAAKIARRFGLSNVPGLPATWSR